MLKLEEETARQAAEVLELKKVINVAETLKQGIKIFSTHYETEWSNNLDCLDGT